MSNVQHETDTGPEDSDSERDDVLQAQRTQTDSSEDAVQASSIVEILEDVRRENLQNRDDSHNGRTSGSYRSARSPEDEYDIDELNGEVLASPAGQKPSSADSSLSTQDDTPSVQVCTLGSTSLGKFMICLRILYSLRQGGIPVPHGVDTARRLPFVLSTGGSKHGFFHHL